MSARENHPMQERQYSPLPMSSFLTWGDFHARSRFVRSTIPEEKWGIACNLRQGRLRRRIFFQYKVMRKDESVSFWRENAVTTVILLMMS